MRSSRKARAARYLWRILPPLKEPAEPKQIQHAIDVVLKEPNWLTASTELKTIDGIAFKCEDSIEQP
jgi:hypothetical protein